MAVQLINMKCSGCGETLSPSMSECPSCGNAVVFSSFNSILKRTEQDLGKLARKLENDPDANSPEMGNMVKFTLASCYLKLRLYDKALAKFEAAIEENLDNPETYFYAAVSLLKGKKACLTPMTNIRKALEYLDAATDIEPRGVFYFFKAYLKYDFFARKYLQVTPDYKAELRQAIANNLSPFDAEELFSILGVECPAALAI